MNYTSNDAFDESIKKNNIESILVESVSKYMIHSPNAIAVFEGDDLELKYSNPLFEKIVDNKEVYKNRFEPTLKRSYQTRDVEILNLGGDVSVELPSLLFVPLHISGNQKPAILILAYENDIPQSIKYFTNLGDEKFKFYVEAMPQMAFIADVEGNIIYFNQRWYDYVGQVGETVGWRWKDRGIHHPKDLQRTIDVWTHSLKTGKPYEIEYRLKNKDGQYRWFLGRAEPIYGVEGNIEVWLGTNTDIHQQKMNEEALKNNEEYYRIMADHVPIITWITNQDGACLYLNQQWYDYTGQAENEALGSGWDKAVHPEDLENTYNVFLSANENQIPFDLEYRIRSRNGEYMWHLGSGLPKFSADGEYEGFVGAVINIDERKKAEQKLTESEEFSRTLLESSPDCIKAIDLDGRLLAMNPSGMSMNHIKDFAAFKNKPWLDLWVGDYYHVAKGAFEKARSGDVGHFSGTTVNSAGQKMWWDVLTAPVFDADGKVDGIVAVSRDITKIKELEQQKDDFLSIASHELKTPVTSIKAYAQVLKNRFSKMDDVMSAEMLDKMDMQLNKLTSLISDLLDVTKVQQGKLVLKKEFFDLNSLSADVIEEISRTAAHYNIEYDGSGVVQVHADKERIRQVIINFLTNAIKYSPGTKNIVVCLSKDENKKECVLSVRDFGIGIDACDQRRVFERFYRAEGEGSETFPGLGLGLYISADIIDRHGGKVWVDSKKGEGSEFFFSLPLTSGIQN